MMLCYSKISKIKYFLDPPKKAQGYERSRYVYMHTCFSIQSAVTWMFTRSRLSSLSDLDNKVIPSLKNIIEL